MQRPIIGGTEHLEAEADRLMEELAPIANIFQQTIDENAHIAQNQDDYQKRYDEQADRYRKTEDELKKVQKATYAIQYSTDRIDKLTTYVNSVRFANGEFIGFENSYPY